jgi:hypothetical protein
MGAIVSVSAINKMVIRWLNIILLISTGVIAVGVVIVYTNKHAHAHWYHHSIGVQPNILTQMGDIAPSGLQGFHVSKASSWAPRPAYKEN